MHHEQSLILATQHNEALLAAAAGERLAAQTAAPGRGWREQVGAGLLRLRRWFAPATPVPAPRQARPAC